MADKTERMTAEQFRNRTTVTPAGQRHTTPVGTPPPLAPQARTATQFFVGIDPGRSTGFALWEAKLYNTSGQFIEVNTLTFWATIRRLSKLIREFGAAALHVRIEDVRANKPTFKEREGNAAVRERMSQNIGANKRDCQLIIDFLEDQKVPYTALPPRTRAAGKGKVQAAYFAGFKGFPSKSSEHARDASYLVAGL